MRLLRQYRRFSPFADGSDFGHLLSAGRVSGDGWDSSFTGGSEQLVRREAGRSRRTRLSRALLNFDGGPVPPRSPPALTVSQQRLAGSPYRYARRRWYTAEVLHAV
jgi:hypothetical protein